MGGNFMLQGIGLYCMNAFMEPLTEAHGWSRLAINNSLGLSVLLGQIAMPIAAAIANKISLRLLMTLGALAGGLSICGMGLTSSIHLFTVFLIILWVSSQFFGGVVGNALMANWFDRDRGLAFGFANAGGSMAGIFLPLITLFLIHQTGLRNAYLCLGVLTVLFAPVCWVIVRRTPAQLHLHPDGSDHDPEEREMKKISANVWTLLRTPAVWYIGLCFGLALMTGAGIMSQLKPRFSDVGISPYTAMLLTAAASFSSTAAKYFWGRLTDRTNPFFTSRIIMFSCCASFLLLCLPPSMLTLAAFGIFFSFASGGFWVAFPAIVSAYFGPANFLGVYRIISIFIILRCFGFSIMGMSHEYAGSYDLADLAFFGAMSISLMLTLLLKRKNAWMS